MPRRSIEDLPKPPKRFRPDRGTDAAGGKIGFETKADAKMEDGLRITSLKLLSKRRSQVDLITRERIRGLIFRIDTGASPASCRYMRKHRVRIAGHLWWVLASSSIEASAFTLIPRSWEFAGGDLDRADPRKMIEQLRAALYRAGAEASDGWLFAAIHGEYDAGDDVYRLHVHGIALGGMIAVVDRLRKQRDFKRARKAKDSNVPRRVRMTRKPLEDLPEPLTYTVQRFWPAKASFELKSGERKRQRDKRRIRQPHHSEVLLWLDCWRLRDLTLLVGRSVTRSGFRKVGATHTNGSRS